MKKRNKIIITMLMVITMLSVMAVSTFASGNVLKGEQTVNNQELLGTWVFINDIPIAASVTFDIKFESNGTEYYGIEVIASDLNPRMLYINEDNSTVVVYVAYNSVWENENFKTINITEYRGPEDDDIYDSYVVSLNYFATKTGPITGGSTGILDVASEIPSFLVNVFVPLISIFYADGAFTIIGVLSLAAFAFFLILLLFQVIKRFVQFRG